MRNRRELGVLSIEATVNLVALTGVGNASGAVMLTERSDRGIYFP
jgi:hypothetical protein